MKQIAIERKKTRSGKERVLYQWTDNLGLLTYRWVWADADSPKYGFLNRTAAEKSFRELNR